MRAKNSKDVTLGYCKFSIFLIASVFTGVLIYFCYINTSNVEVNRIVDKTVEYDKIYALQIDLSNRIDSLYSYATMFNTNLNDAQLLRSVSRRRQEIMSIMNNMSNRDVRLHQRLMREVNVFIDIKDSIRIAKVEEDMVKADLLRCAEENRQTSRRLSLGGITINR